MPVHRARLNILLVMVEQFSGLADPNDFPMPVDMPALRGLAKRGTRFRRAYCNAPVCGPSRLSFLTGRYVCNCGGYDNGSILPPHVPTFGHLLTRAGYSTALCGRMHIHGLDQHRGFEHRLCSEIIDPCEGVPAIWPDPLVEPGPLPPPASTRYEQRFRDELIFRHDAYVTEQACRFLEQVDAGDPPFCLVAGYFGAHSGSAPNPAHEPFYRKYLTRDLPLPSFTRADYERLPEHARRLHHYARTDERVYDPEFQRHALAAYLGRLEYLDIQLARLLEALERSGQADRTIVIFTSDHGEMMGRHGLWGKMIFYEESQRVPLYIVHPDAAASKTVDQVVSLIDVLPTLADFAGVDVPFPYDGQSLTPLLQASSPHDPTAVAFSEYHGHLSGSDMYMVVTDRYKLCHYMGEADELYDLSSDPTEVHNRIDDPRYSNIRQILQEEIDARVDTQRMAKVLHEYRQQRDAIHQAIASSRVISDRIRQRNKAWRQALNEPWWDGGKYLAFSEKGQRGYINDADQEAPPPLQASVSP